jgi:hypothetical protein
VAWAFFQSQAAKKLLLDAESFLFLDFRPSVDESMVEEGIFIEPSKNSLTFV